MDRKAFAIRYARTQHQGDQEEPLFLQWVLDEQEARKVGAGHFGVPESHVLVAEGTYKGEPCFYLDYPDRQDVNLDDDRGTFGI